MTDKGKSDPEQVDQIESNVTSRLIQLNDAGQKMGEAKAYDN